MFRGCLTDLAVILIGMLGVKTNNESVNKIFKFSYPKLPINVYGFNTKCYINYVFNISIFVTCLNVILWQYGHNPRHVA